MAKKRSLTPAQIRNRQIAQWARTLGLPTSGPGWESTKSAYDRMVAEFSGSEVKAPKARKARSTKAQTKAPKAAPTGDQARYHRLIQAKPELYGTGLRALGEVVVMDEKQAKARQRLARSCGYC